MRREGSPWRGLSAVMMKELADNLSSARMRVLELLVLLTAFAALYGAIQQVRDTTAEDPFVFLRLFTSASGQLPPFMSILGFLVPLMAIGLGFDAINGEHSRRTLSRVLAQPIYRDALLLGKFLAGVITLGISLSGLWLLVIGLGLISLGVPPSTEEIARALLVLVIAIAYACVWLAAAMLFSVIFRSPATAALTTLGIWLFLSVLWPLLAPAIATAIAPPDLRAVLTGQPNVATVEWTQALLRLSPTHLFTEAMIALFNPSTRSLGTIFLSQLQGAVVGAPLPLWQSMLIAWPQTVGLIAASIVLFVIGYVCFQRQEVRA